MASRRKDGPQHGPAIDAAWSSAYSAVGEAVCPVHCGQLNPVHDLPPNRLAGHCALCGKFWGVNVSTLEAGWWAGPYPAGAIPAAGDVSLPGWMTAE
jgi:hypothetical protein